MTSRRARAIKKYLLKEHKGKRKKLTYSPKATETRIFRREMVSITSPEVIDLYGKKNHLRTVNFLKKIETELRRNCDLKFKIHICFKDCKVITASGGIYLKANMELLIHKYPGNRFTVTQPLRAFNSQAGAYNSKPVVHSVLSQIGFYSLLKVHEPKLPQLPNVDCWNISSGQLVDSQALAEAIEKVGLEKSENAAVFRSTIEAMANAAEHAYTAKVPRTAAFNLEKWWLFTAIIDGRFYIYFCDVGHGIPATLKHTQPVPLMHLIYRKLESLGKKPSFKWLEGDVYAIKASTIVKETRTSESNRGKGIKDIRSLIQKTPGSRLVIYSNRGSYLFNHKKVPYTRQILRRPGLLEPNEDGWNNKLSICGTIVGWSVPLRSSQRSGEL